MIRLVDNRVFCSLCLSHGAGEKNQTRAGNNKNCRKHDQALKQPKITTLHAKRIWKNCTTLKMVMNSRTRMEPHFTFIALAQIHILNCFYFDLKFICVFLLFFWLLPCIPSGSFIFFSFFVCVMWDDNERTNKISHAFREDFRIWCVHASVTVSVLSVCICVQGRKKQMPFEIEF